ncbi:hypothetical protein [Pseudomonas serbica]|uniref:hypothetical protein n=1 Tax=Pseudomonas serbica TaxID=2965074 RepID=UPI0039E416EF
MDDEKILQIRYVQYGDELVLHEPEMPLDVDELSVLRHVLVTADPTGDGDGFSDEDLSQLSVEELRNKLSEIGVSHVSWNVF